MFGARRYIIFLLPLVVMACSLDPEPKRGFSYLNAGIRSGQEQACAAAVAQMHDVPIAGVKVDRTSADAYNRATIAFAFGEISGYCRVSAKFQVLDIIS